MQNFTGNIFAIETSCDDTALAIVNAKDGILYHRVFSQTELHAAYGGVVPEIASRNHLRILHKISHELLQSYEESNREMSANSIDAVAVTSGPGLIGGVIVGVMFAKGIAAVLRKPCIPINHLAGHALMARFTNKIDFPYLLLLISGGHCQLLVVDGPLNYTMLGQTRDDAIGEAFDKVAKMLGLGYPGGPVIEQRATKGDKHYFSLPKPFVGSDGCEFSFSGLKTAVSRYVMSAKEHNGITERFIDNMCASFQHTVTEILSDRVYTALKLYNNHETSACDKLKDTHTTGERGTVKVRTTPRCANASPHNHSWPLRSVVIAGGVASNMYIYNTLKTLFNDCEIHLYRPPTELCPDNAVMIAWAAIEMIRNNDCILQNHMSLDFMPRSHWPLDDL